MMLKAVVMLLMLILLEFAFSMDALCEGKQFKDADESHWAYQYIKDMTDAGYFSGYPDGTFKPENMITRAEFFKVTDEIIRKIYGSNIKISSSELDMMKEYPDFKKGHWAYEYYRRVNYYIYIFSGATEYNEYNTGMKDVFGYETREPNKAITREEVVALLDCFTDGGKVAIKPWEQFSDCFDRKFSTQILSSKYIGFISGYPDGNFKPTNNIKRSEAARILSSFVEKQEFLKKLIWDDTPVISEDAYKDYIDPVSLMKIIIKNEAEGKYNLNFAYCSMESRDKLDIKDYKPYMKNLLYNATMYLSDINYNELEYKLVTLSYTRVAVYYRNTENVERHSITGAKEFVKENGKWYMNINLFDEFDRNMADRNIPW